MCLLGVGLGTGSERDFSCVWPSTVETEGNRRSGEQVVTGRNGIAQHHLVRCNTIYHNIVSCSKQHSISMP